MTEPLNESESSARASSISSSESYTLAKPLKYKPSLPVILATEPSVAMLPNRHCKWPVSLMGLSRGRMISWPSLRSGQDARFSAMVFPVHVMQLPSMRPFFMRNCGCEGSGEVSGRTGVRANVLRFTSARIWRAARAVLHPPGKIRTVKRIYRHRPKAIEGESNSFIFSFPGVTRGERVRTTETKKRTTNVERAREAKTRVVPRDAP